MSYRKGDKYVTIGNKVVEILSLMDGQVVYRESTGDIPKTRTIADFKLMVKNKLNLPKSVKPFSL